MSKGQSKNEIFSEISGHCFNKEGEFEPSNTAIEKVAKWLLLNDEDMVDCYANSTSDELIRQAVANNSIMSFAEMRADIFDKAKEIAYLFIEQNEFRICEYYEGSHLPEPEPFDHSEMVRQTILDSQAIFESSLK